MKVNPRKTSRSARKGWTKEDEHRFAQHVIGRASEWQTEEAEVRQLRVVREDKKYT